MATRLKPKTKDETTQTSGEAKTSQKETEAKSTDSPQLVASETAESIQASEQAPEKTDKRKPASTVESQKAQAEKLLDAGQVDKAVVVLDQAMTQDFMAKHGKEVKNNNPMSIQAMQKRLKEADKKAGTKSAVVYMHLREKQGLDLILLTASGKPVHKYVDIKRDTLVNDKEQFFNKIPSDKFGFEASADKYSKRLYKNLITPIEAFLPKNGNIMFAVDQELQLLPFAALIKPTEDKEHKPQNQEILNRDKPYLIKDFAISMIPSFQSTNTDYRSLKDLPVSAMGASSFKDGYLKYLSSVPTELDQATRMTGSPKDDGKIILNKEFNLSNLSSSKTPMVHIASHGGPTGISTSDPLDQINAKDLQQIKWSQKPELLTLSASNTALGGKNNPYGLTGNAYLSGAKSVMGSLWSPDDNSTMATMTSFYLKLQNQGMTKAEALRETQLALLDGTISFAPDGQSLTLNKDGKNVKIADPSLQQEVSLTESEFSQKKPPDRKDETSFSWPYYWAAFMLLGSPW
jgi:CHAT domain-containing protein